MKEDLKDLFEEQDGGCTVFNDLKAEDFVRLFGCEITDIPDDCLNLINQYDFRFMELENDEYDQVILDVLKRLDSGQFTMAGKDGKERWESGWSENLQSFIEHDHDLTKLVPKYIRPNQPVRLDKRYVMPVSQTFELNWFEIFRRWLFTAYLKDVDVVYEFGCGTGFNLVALASLYPKKRFFGLDWTTASVKIVNELAKTYDWDMKGLLFDFFSPDQKIKIADNSAILTIGALEQTGRDWEPFLQYILKNSPKLCIHVEPIVEWYDDNNLTDYMGIRFLKQRHYWEGFPNRLKTLEEEGVIEILKTKRSYFGSLYVEGYSQIIWRPC